MLASCCHFSPITLLFLLPSVALQQSTRNDQPLLHAYDLAPPLNEEPPLVSFPVFVDSVSASNQFELYEGDDFEAHTNTFAQRHGFGSNPDQVQSLQEACRMRLKNLSLGSAALKVAVVIAYEDDFVDTVNLNSTGISSSNGGINSNSDALAIPVLWQLVTQALAHGNSNECGSGVHLVLVTNGFGLGDDVRAALIAKCGRGIRNNNDNRGHSSHPLAELDRRACGSIAVVEVREVIGFGAAVNLAMEHLHAPEIGLLQQARLHHNNHSGADDNYSDDGDNDSKLHARNMPTLFRAAVVTVTSAASPLRPNLEPDCAIRYDRRISSPNSEVHGYLDDSLAAVEGCDVWHAYASVALARGGSRVTPPPLVFVAPPSPQPRVEVKLDKLRREVSRSANSAQRAAALEAWAEAPCVACAAPMPLLVFDAALWRTPSASVSSSLHDAVTDHDDRNRNHRSFEGSWNNASQEAWLGPLDDGFWLQGAVGEWVYRAQRRNLFVDASSHSSNDGSVKSQAFLNFDSRFLLPFPTRQRNLMVEKAKTDSPDGGDGTRGAPGSSPTSTRSNNSSSLGVSEHEPQLVGPFSMPSSALMAVESLAVLDVDHLLVHLQAEHCQPLPSRSHHTHHSLAKHHRPLNSARCHFETVGASLEVLQKRANNEVQDNRARAYDGDSGSLGKKDEPRPAAQGWRNFMDMLTWQWQWMGRRPTSVAADGWADQLRVGAVMLLYDDALNLVANLLPDLLASVHHTVVLVSSEPWHGQPRDVQPTLALLARFLADPKHTTRLSVVPGLWKSEAEQRAFGNAFLRSLPTPTVAGTPDGFTHVLVVDGDEFWHPAELHRSLCLVASVARNAHNRYIERIAATRGGGDGMFVPEKEVEDEARRAAAATIPFARSSMATYWKTVRGVIDPPEALQILWLVSLELCNWTKDREIECALPATTASSLRRLQQQHDNRDNNGDESSGAIHFDGLFLDPSAGVCHHLSYVRTTLQLVHQKLASFAHAQDVIEAAGKRYNTNNNGTCSGGGTSNCHNGLGQWISETWHKWDEDHTLRHLHPTHPPAYDHVRAQALHALPPALRKTHLHTRRKKSLLVDSSAADDDEGLNLYSLIPKVEGATFSWRFVNLSLPILDALS